MATGVEVMTQFVNVMKNYSQDTTSNIIPQVLDEAVRSVSAFDSLNEAIGVLGAALFTDELQEYEGLDSDARLEKATGMILGADSDTSVDTGAITGYNAGGSTVKNAQDIVPEDGDLSTATLPEPGSTTPISFTGNDGKTITFNVKWPDSFSQFVSGTAVDDETEPDVRLKDSRFLVDLNNFDPNEKFVNDEELFEMMKEELFEAMKEELGEFDTANVSVSDPAVVQALNIAREKAPVFNATYGTMKESAISIIKGLNTYWLKEAAKLSYDSYGLSMEGTTLEMKFMAGGNEFNGASGITTALNGDGLPAKNIIMGINIFTHGQLDPTDPNGLELNTSNLYLDRVVAHEMVHAAMLATGTLKKSGMPLFFAEGIADLVQGDDDYNSEQLGKIHEILSGSDTFMAALSVTNEEGTAYPAGDMLLRFIAKQSADATIFVGNDENKNQTINFTGNDTVINNYAETNTIHYAAGFKIAKTSGAFNDLVVEPDDDHTFILRNVRGKLINVSSDYGNVNAYMASDAGEVDISALNGGNAYTLIFGADNVDNVIRAGNKGSYLWGGYFGNDDLYGGAGADIFIYDLEGGNDTIHNAESQDTVVLRNMQLEQISSAEFTDNGLKASFTYGGSLTIEGQPSNFILESSNASFSADYQNKTWRSNNA